MREARIDLGLPAFAIEGFENQQHDSHHGPTYSGTSNYQYTVDVTYSAFGKEKHIRREDNNALKKGESKPININYIMDTNHLSKKVKVPRWFQTGDVDTYSIFRNGNSVLFQGLISISQVNNKLATVSPFEQNKITVKAHGETQVTAPDIDKYHKHGGKIHAHGHVHNLNP